MQHTLVQKYAKPMPRYTSYPTVPHFHGGVDNTVYRAWLSEIDDTQTLSLYVHIPFCDTMCWFCGCNTKHTMRYQPVTRYLPVLKLEIATVAGCAGQTPRLQTIHWGGGSPTILTPDDILDLAGHIRRSFNIDRDASFSIEIDPRGMEAGKIEALARAGVTRASIGVQDFDPYVQAAINRRQSFCETSDVISGLRAAGIDKINLDLIYGLPSQTVQSVAKTVEQVLELSPDRIALFGYAHVPWMKKHQKMINEAALPDAAERFEQSQLMADLLCQAGYERIGMDHFAQPGDPLTRAMHDGRLRRNFQGYTDDPADVLLGVGASAIGKLPQGYVHNATPTGDYMKRIEGQGLAVVNGYELMLEDELCAHVVERLICEFEFSCEGLRDRFGKSADGIARIADTFAASDENELVEWDGGHFRITPRGRPFVRNICAQFDMFLGKNGARHSLSV